MHADRRSQPTPAGVTLDDEDPRLFLDEGNRNPCSIAMANRRWAAMVMLNPSTPLADIIFNDATGQRVLGPPKLRELAAQELHLLLSIQIIDLVSQLASGATDTADTISTFSAFTAAAAAPTPAAAMVPTLACTLLHPTHTAETHTPTSLFPENQNSPRSSAPPRNSPGNSAVPPIQPSTSPSACHSHRTEPLVRRNPIQLDTFTPTDDDLDRVGGPASSRPAQSQAEQQDEPSFRPRRDRRESDTLPTLDSVPLRQGSNSSSLYRGSQGAAGSLTTVSSPFLARYSPSLQPHSEHTAASPSFDIYREVVAAAEPVSRAEWSSTATSPTAAAASATAAAAAGGESSTGGLLSAQRAGNPLYRDISFGADLNKLACAPRSREPSLSQSPFLAFPTDSSVSILTFQNSSTAANADVIRVSLDNHSAPSTPSHRSRQPSHHSNAFSPRIPLPAGPSPSRQGISELRRARSSLLTHTPAVAAPFEEVATVHSTRNLSRGSVNIAGLRRGGRYTSRPPSSRTSITPLTHSSQLHKLTPSPVKVTKSGVGSSSVALTSAGGATEATLDDVHSTLALLLERAVQGRASTAHALLDSDPGAVGQATRRAHGGRHTRGASVASTGTDVFSLLSANSFELLGSHLPGGGGSGLHVTHAHESLDPRILHQQNQQDRVPPPLSPSNGSVLGRAQSAHIERGASSADPHLDAISIAGAQGVSASVAPTGPTVLGLDGQETATGHQLTAAPKPAPLSPTRTPQSTGLDALTTSILNTLTLAELFSTLCTAARSPTVSASAELEGRLAPPTLRSGSVFGHDQPRLVPSLSSLPSLKSDSVNIAGLGRGGRYTSRPAPSFASAQLLLPRAPKPDLDPGADDDDVTSNPAFGVEARRSRDSATSVCVGGLGGRGRFSARPVPMSLTLRSAASLRYASSALEASGAFKGGVLRSMADMPESELLDTMNMCRIQRLTQGVTQSVKQMSSKRVMAGITVSSGGTSQQLLSSRPASLENARAALLASSRVQLQHREEDERSRDDDGEDEGPGSSSVAMSTMLGFSAGFAFVDAAGGAAEGVEDLEGRQEDEGLDDGVEEGEEEAEEEEFCCPVCLEDLTAFNHLHLATCSHILCVECASEIVRLHEIKPALCPLCRVVIGGFALPQ
ncbi:MAG: hypothetical protein WDW38_008972 [Sanguina aurantia]